MKRLRAPWQQLAAPVAAAVVTLSMAGTATRPFLLIAIPALVLGAVDHRLARAPAAALGVLFGVLALGAGLIAQRESLLLAALLYLLAGLSRAWGINRGKRHPWLRRGLTAVGVLVVAFFVVYPVLLAVDYLAKPREPISAAALGEPVSFPARDGARLAGWYMASRNGAAVVLVHGGGGDRQGVIRHARMLAAAGYGVLLYDARGRGASAGHENAFGWEWDRDVHGAVSYLRQRGIRRIGLLGVSTGAEAVVTEAARDPRVGAVVADGLQGRTVADAGRLGWDNRLSVLPAFAVVGALIRLSTGQAPPPPLYGLVHELARTRPLLLIGTVGFEREFDRAYTQGTSAQLWELPHTAHTAGLADQPRAYAARVLAIFDDSL